MQARPIVLSRRRLMRASRTIGCSSAISFQDLTSAAELADTFLEDQISMN